MMPGVREMLTVVDEGARFCGDCSACCTVLGVRDLEPPKPDYVACSDCLPDGGCARYATRPPTCKGYVCGWLHGWGEEGDRPDKLGLILEPWHRPPDGGGAGIIVREVWPGAAESPAGRKLLEPVSLRTLVLIVSEGGKRTCIGPMGRLRMVETIVQARLAERAKG